MARCAVSLALIMAAFWCSGCSCRSGLKGTEIGKWSSADGTVTLEFTKKGGMTTTIGNASVLGKYKWISDTTIEVDMPMAAGVSQKQTRSLAYDDGKLSLTDDSGRTTTFSRSKD
jgi:hypothetical protein